ncbi:PE-PPE domain-containing protein [Mycolicibacterium sp. CBM1]
MTASAATTVLYVGGTSGTLGESTPAAAFGTTADLLGGELDDDTVAVVGYPASLWPITGLHDPTLGASIATGVADVEAAVAATTGPLMIVGTSQGSMVAQQVAADLNDDLSVPSSTTFVLIADPNFGLFLGDYGIKIPILDYVPEALTETRFNVVVVINEYDGFADPITHPENLLTDLNALMGIVYVHPYAQNTDLSTVPASDITTTTNSAGGTTTVYRVPTQDLPLTMPLRQLGVPAAAVDALDAVLRPIIDAGYADSPPAPTPRVAALSAGVSVHRSTHASTHAVGAAASSGAGSATSTSRRSCARATSKSRSHAPGGIGRSAR